MNVNSQSIKIATPAVVSIEMFYNNSIRHGEVAKRFFELFRSVFPSLEFNLMGQWEPLRKKFDLDQALMEWQMDRSKSNNQFGDYVFHGKSAFSFYAFAHWFGRNIQNHWADSISVMFDEKLWLEDGMKDLTEKSVNLLKGLSSLGSPLYGRAYHWSEFEAKGFRDRVLKDGRVARESISLTPRQGILDLFWLNYFGRPYVNVFGEQKLKRIRAYSKELVGSGFLVVTSPDPFHWKDSEIRQRQEEIKAQLDGGAFPDWTTNFKPNLTILPET